jgi:aminoglycoside phosphotransferase (APT) family kinase protein
MQLNELTERLGPFVRAKYADESARVFDIDFMPGHAGFAYGFSVAYGVSDTRHTDSWFLRLPPPNVNWRGTADVLRQVEVLNVLDDTAVPHCSVKWSAAGSPNTYEQELKWFGCPYFVVPKLEGDVIRLAPGTWGHTLSLERRQKLGKQVMRALVDIHALEWQGKLDYLGAPVALHEDVIRWDRLFEKSADAERLKHAPKVRERLLATLPEDAPVGVFHGDFQIANLFCSTQAELIAVIDWELVGIGATLNDLGWITIFSDPLAWHASAERHTFLDPETLVEYYSEALGKPVPQISWFQALAAYKFALISGFNLNLHRRGKREDPMWEDARFSMDTLIDRALSLLD